MNRTVLIILMCMSLFGIGLGDETNTVPRDGLVAWFDAGDITGISQGNQVSSWIPKQSLPGVDPMIAPNAGDGHAPVYQSAHGDFNGHPCLSFSEQVRDQDYFVSKNMVSDFLSGSSVTVFFVSQGPCLGLLNFTAPRLYFSGNQLTFGGGTADKLNLGTERQTAIRTYSVDAAKKEAKGWLNGQLMEVLNLSARPAGDFSYGSVRGLRMGSAGVGANHAGCMAEVLIYNRVLSGREIDAILAYLGAKYGIMVNWVQVSEAPVAAVPVQTEPPVQTIQAGFIPSIFGNNMVLQESSQISVWGEENPGVEVTVKVSWLTEAVSAVADSNGKWEAHLQTPEASFTSHTVEVCAGETVRKYENVLIGQVWLCSGQSNMGCQLSRTDHGADEAGTANYPNIRFYQGQPVSSPVVLKDVKGSWTACSPQSAPDFSAAAYYFGKELFKKINKPIGLIHVSWGGTPVEAWMSAAALEKCPDYSRYLTGYWKPLDAKYPESKRNYDIALQQWRAAGNGNAAQSENLALMDSDQKSKGSSKRPSEPRELRVQNKPGYCFNAMIAPIVGYKIAGVIWYQGEANSPAASYPYYRDAFAELITDWRGLWHQDNLPFIFAQVSASTGYGIGIAHVRQAQMMVLKTLPNTGMAVTMDIGDAKNHHPGNKKDVGYRLSLWALKNVYGFPDIVPSGPLYKSKTVEGGKLRLYFDYADGGLIAKDGKPLSDFAVCGQDGVFYLATAEISGDTVLAGSDQVSQPVHASFAWTEYAEPNFYNRDHLPASPFNTLELEK